MGDRAVVMFHAGDKDGGRVSPATYLHWGGSMVADLLAKTRDRMRERGADVAYTSARFTGICHEATPGALSLGTWNGPGHLPDDPGARQAIFGEMSHGDAGCFLVDVRDWSVEVFGGYGFSEGRFDWEHQTCDLASWCPDFAERDARRQEA